MNWATKDFRRTSVNAPEEFHKGLDGVLKAGVGRYRRRSGVLKKIMDDACRISAMADDLHSLSNKVFSGKLREMRTFFRRGRKECPQMLPEALAILVDAARRTLGLRPFSVQITGALCLHRGYLAEMATGEGKSLTACLPAILAGWTGRPCHIVTVNDYLTKRDALEMKALYEFCGVSAGCVTSGMAPDERRLNYDRGAMYTTSKELVADFLRDRLIMGSLHDPSRRLIRHILFPDGNRKEGLVLRGLDTAIVDEADSVLIDEAVTPLIISQVRENRLFTQVYSTAGRIAKKLVPDIDYTADLKYKEIVLKKSALAKIAEKAEKLPGIWRNTARSEEVIKQALAAREFYRRDEQYVIQDGHIVIVDEFTGRLMPDRTWRQGFHQAVEAKENLELSNPSETMARRSFQQFFRIFTHLSGMTGTGREAAGEFWQIYGLPVLKVPTNRPCVRKLFPDRIFGNAAQKWTAVMDEIITIHKTGRPILVGTRNVFASEKLANLLRAEKLAFNLLNAVHHEEEASIVRVAGEEARITISTNMAGRGTDIKLHGKVAEKGGLHVIATERHESGRIDRQLFGRSARQGDPGSAQAFVSMEDELICRFVPAVFQRQLKSVLERKIPGAACLAGQALSHAQRAAQQLAFSQRKNVLRMDTWIEDALSFSGPDMFM